MSESRVLREEFEKHEMPDLWSDVQERRLLPELRQDRPGLSGALRRHPWRSGLAVAGLAAAVAIALPLVLPGGPGGADPAAAAMLRQVARRAAAQPPQPAPAPGQYVYTKSESSQTYLYVAGSGLRSFSFTQPLTRESWTGPDGWGRILETGGPISFPSPQDRQAWVAAGSPDLDEASGDEIFRPEESDYRDYSQLPTDPTELRAMIEDREVESGPPGEGGTFTIIGDLLRETYTSPAVRGALYEVAADLPGVEWVGKTVDGAGRAGVAVAYTHDGIRTELIFDPNTAELLGETEILTEDSRVDVEGAYPGTIYGGWGRAGTIAYQATYLASRVTGSLRERP
jgi:hypothetical protein